VVAQRGTLLGKHDVAYFRCPACEFWFTEEPYWLDEAYAEAIDASDMGLVQRNLTMARTLGMVLPRLYPTGPYVDWAGGCGLLVRLMRDAGFDFYWQDRYAHNLLAQGFEWETHQAQFGGKAPFVSAIEVLEHTPDPVGFVRDVFDSTGAQGMFFTECLHDGATYDPTWWYLLPEVGQHISFYSAKTLQTLAGVLGLSLLSSGDSHLLTKQPIEARRFRKALRGSKLVNVMTRVPGRLSMTPASMAWHASSIRRGSGGAV
jgi:hypothetical protein